MFSSVVDEHWFESIDRSQVPGSPGQLRVHVDDTLTADRRVMVLELAGSGGVVSVTSAAATELHVRSRDELAAAEFKALLDGAAVEMNGADQIFYFAADAQAQLRMERTPAHVRRLTNEDAGAFAAFAAAAPEDDLEEAYVELDHWLAFGAFAGDELACAASMYPWRQTSLADLGVITLPQFRGRGLARETVRAISTAAFAAGYEPQYRCQLDNLASIALADAAGLIPFATWDVVAQDADT
ncbi:GNAT family N-acetyltransferase [Nocardioides sp.]|uniref:GNAT family N-acetyltransferase n=1 Tax=Nocardioides sp. TaxID=35761 RepID=UPI002BE2C2B2|nr:GNAT family N-acetyltransferase [Nocardioides sp.]HXH77027.1 GNAT family N-acetyltransferase [Nocardioides sp.]